MLLWLVVGVSENRTNRNDFLMLLIRFIITHFFVSVRMSDIQNTRFLRALRRQPIDKTPIWIMRQAGRYLPEYRAMREKAGNFLTLCKTPEMACEVTLQPLRRFDLDAAIIFSDILTIPDAMGLGLYFETNEGPRFSHPVRDIKSINNLVTDDLMSRLDYVTAAIRLVAKELDGKLPLIGFSGSPWTLATYMVEGASSKNFHIIKRFLYTEPQAMNLLLDKLVVAITEYLCAQATAGASALMIFDTWGGILTSESYQHYSLNPVARIIANVKQRHPNIPMILFTKGGGQWLSEMVECGADGLGLDWTIDIGRARKLTQDKITLQGNMDPSMLYANPDQIRNTVKNILSSYGKGSGHIFNLGHGIHPDISPDAVAVLVEAVHEFSEIYHQ